MSFFALSEKEKSIDCTIIIPIGIVNICFLRRSTLYDIVYVSSTFIWRRKCSEIHCVSVLSTCWYLQCVDQVVFWCRNFYFNLFM